MLFSGKDRTMFELKRITKVISEPILVRWILIGLGLVITMLTFTVIIWRYFLQVPLMWGEEVILYILPWFYVTGAVYATYDRSHIKGEMVHLLFQNHPRVLATFRAAAAFLCAGLSGLFSVWAYTNFTWQLGAHSRTTYLSLPLAYSHLALFLGFALMVVYFLFESIGTVRGEVRRVSANPPPGRGGL